MKATYLKPQVADELRFSLGLDTHSGNLDDYDLKTIVVLRDDTGKIYQPTRVEGTGSGHHRVATIMFSRPGGKKVELVVKDVAGVKERTFRWDLE